MQKASLCLLTGKMVKSFLWDGCSDWANSKFIPTGWKLNSFILNRFSLNPNCPVKICLAYRIQMLHWKYHIGLFIYQETNKQWQNNWYEKWKVFTLPVDWKDRELFPEGLIFKQPLAGDILNSFQLDWILHQITSGYKIYKLYMLMYFFKWDE
jgi:hypothetical protein